jgi:predicted ester cyclase
MRVPSEAPNVNPMALAPSTRSQLIARAVEAINRHDLAGYEQVFDPAVVTINPVRGNPVGRSEASTEMGALLEALPDLTVSLEEVIESGNRTVSLLALTGTNTGSWRGHPPTGRFVRLRICRIGEWVGEQVVTIGSYWDELTLLRQLGLATIS